MQELKKSTLVLVVLLFSLINHPSAKGSDFHSPRTAALGGAGHAGPMLNDAIFLNPSYASFLPAYTVSFNYLPFNSDPNAQNPGSDGRIFNLSIQDGRSELFQAGVAYTKRHDATFINIGASKAIVQRVGVGMGAKMIMRDQERMIQDLTFSTLWVPFTELQVAFIIDNALQTKEGLKLNLHREMILGTKLNLMGLFMLYFDPHHIPDIPSGQKFGYEAGAEFAMFQDFFLRLGAFRNATIPYQPTYGRGLGLGFGWVAPKISLDYGFKRVFAANDGFQRSWAHVFGATIFF